ncbi:MAG: GntR family transcriptional regulator [Acholeplasma sp.]|nr:GntR family transcriptional regulator [Acholeplasma sp.]
MWTFDNKTPIYLQIMEQIKIEIITGKLKPGDKILPIRDLALLTKTNPNTIQKALFELEELRLINTQRTNGKFVTDDLGLISETRENVINNRIKNFIDEMDVLEVSIKEIEEHLLVKRENKND